MVGILPLASHRNAEFLHNEVPGMSIPAEYRERMAKVGGGPAARAEGIRIAQEALAAVKHRVAGAYVMPPFNRVDAALEVISRSRETAFAHLMRATGSAVASFGRSSSFLISAFARRSFESSASSSS